MLAAEGMLESLSRSENREQYISGIEDYDLGEVLEFCYGRISHKKHKLRYSDGTEGEFSWDE